MADRGEFNSIDDFLKHRGVERGGGDLLEDWKDDGRIVVWLHTKRFPVAKWGHRFPKQIVKEERGKTTVRWVSLVHNCPENEQVLRRQYKTHDDGSRKERPQECGMCFLLEHLSVAVEAGDLAWTDPVFEFTGATSDDDNVTLHAGGMLALFGRELDEEEEEDLKEHGIRPSEAWRENGMAKLQYAMTVVNNEKASDGVQIAIQPQDVGDKIKTVISDRMATLDREEDGNPMIRPYAIELTYDGSKGIAFNKRYHARPYERAKITPEIEKLIRGEPPDLSVFLEPMNQATLRAVMEKYAVVDFPWEKLFRKVAAKREHDREVERRGGGEEERQDRARSGRKKAEKPKGEEDKTGWIPCDDCNEPMHPKMDKCPRCGCEYEVDEDAPASEKEVASKKDGKKSGRR